MKELGIDRGNLETGIPGDGLSTIREHYESHYLPGGFSKSMTPKAPDIEEDLSKLNHPNWNRHQANGRLGKGKHKR